MGDTRKRLDWMFSVYDLDKNGSIQYNEFKALVEVTNNLFYYINVYTLNWSQLPFVIIFNNIFLILFEVYI